MRNETVFWKEKMFTAALRGNIDGIANAIEKGVPPNARDEGGQTVWMTFMLHYPLDAATLRRFIELGADVALKTRDKSGWNTCMYAAMRGFSRETVRIFADAGANLEDKNGEGETAGFITFRNGCNRPCMLFSFVAWAERCSPEAVLDTVRSLSSSRTTSAASGGAAALVLLSSGIPFPLGVRESLAEEFLKTREAAVRFLFYGPSRTRELFEVVDAEKFFTLAFANPMDEPFSNEEMDNLADVSRELLREKPSLAPVVSAAFGNMRYAPEDEETEKKLFMLAALLSASFPEEDGFPVL